MKTPVNKVWAFPSSHGATVYEAIMREDGTISCDCPGWVYRRERECKHTRMIAEGRADQYLVNSAFPSSHGATEGRANRDSVSVIEPQITRRIRM